MVSYPSIQQISNSNNENMMSDLAITMEIVENGQIKFDKKVSCEDVGSQTGNYYDYLAFYIDGVEQEKWAGEIDWSLSTFPLSSGEHILKWAYVKDQGVSSGQDATWIDFIVMPNSQSDFCDISSDGELNIIDVVLLVNFVLGTEEPTNNQFICSDLNDDSSLNVVDIILLVNQILDTL